MLFLTKLKSPNICLSALQVEHQSPRAADSGTSTTSARQQKIPKLSASEKKEIARVLNQSHNIAKKSKRKRVYGLSGVRKPPQPKKIKGTEGRVTRFFCTNPTKCGHSSSFAVGLFSFLDLKRTGDAARNPLEYGASVLKFDLQRELTTNLSLEGSYPDLVMKTPLKYNRENAPLLPLLKGMESPKRIGDLIPVKETKQIMIATTWRSGSSFFGDLLNHYPGTFYSYEPLHLFKHQDSVTWQEGEPVEFVRDVFKCDYDSKVMHSYLKHSSRAENQFLFTVNKRIWRVCQNLLPSKVACFLPGLYDKTCLAFPIHTVKTVRMRVATTETYLKDEEMPNFKLIVLFRDPRGTMNSRASMEWCTNAHCSNTTVVCDHMTSDVRAAYDLSEKFPGRVHLVRYEDLATEPYQVVDELLTFLELPMKHPIETFIETHTKMTRAEKMAEAKKKAYAQKFKRPHSTYRDSKSTAFAWRSKMDWTYIKHIQEQCKEPMDILGYRHMDHPDDRTDESFEIVIKHRDQVWPSDGSRPEGVPQPSDPIIKVIPSSSQQEGGEEEILDDNETFSPSAEEEEVTV